MSKYALQTIISRLYRTARPSMTAEHVQDCARLDTEAAEITRRLSKLCTALGLFIGADEEVTDIISAQDLCDVLLSLGDLAGVATGLLWVAADAKGHCE